MHEICARLEDAIQQDINDRGLSTIFPHARGSLMMASEMLHNGNFIGILTGFNLPPAETDGPPGAIFLAKTLFECGKKVVLITGAFCQSIMQAGLAFLCLEDSIALYATADGFETGDFYSRFSIDVLCSIEVVGPSISDGLCYRAKGLPVTALQDDLWRVFEEAPPHILKIGIGDSGNELGCGRIPYNDMLESSIPLVQKIACRSSCNALVLSGVSNWGAYALALAYLRTVNASPVSNDADIIQGEADLLQVLVDAGARDPRLGHALAVDGLSFNPFHCDLLKRLLSIFHEL